MLIPDKIQVSSRCSKCSGLFLEEQNHPGIKSPAYTGVSDGDLNVISGDLCHHYTLCYGWVRVTEWSGQETRSATLTLTPVLSGRH